MSRFVVDASVAMKWFLPEVHAEAARRLLTGDHSLFVPDLFFPEFGNILWKKARRGEITEDEARQILATLDTVAFRICPTRDILLPALTIAFVSGRTVYDSLYLALAVEESVSLVTADEHLRNGVASGPLARHVLWVADLPLGP